jgi:hypothetical protein
MCVYVCAYVLVNVVVSRDSHEMRSPKSNARVWLNENLFVKQRASVRANIPSWLRFNDFANVLNSFRTKLA